MKHGAGRKLPDTPRSTDAPAATAPVDVPVRVQLVHVLLIVVAALVVYSNTLHNEFHLDDFYRVVGNPGIQQVAPVWRHFTDPATSSTLDRVVQYRPLLPLTLSLNYYLGGTSVPGYHLVNLLFQIIASVLVYFLVLELLRHRTETARRPGLVALAVAALFAVHPVSGITVNYISARDLQLMQVFLTASFLLYVWMRRKGGTLQRWTAVLLLFALSMLSKQNGVIAPLLVLAFEFTAGKQRVWSVGPWLRALPFAAVIGAFFLYTNVILGFSDASNVLSSTAPSAWEYPLTQLRLHLFYYLKNFVWPLSIRQAPLIEPAASPFEPLVLIGAAFIIATLVVAWIVRHTMPLLAFSILAYWILMIPESSLLPLHHHAADYRPYPASPFFFLAGVLPLERYAGRYRMAPAFLLAAVGGAGTASFMLNRTWRTEESLWSHSVRHGGEALAHMNLAMSIADRTDPRVQLHLEEALRLNPNYILARINLGLLLIGAGEEDAGLEQVSYAVALDPGRAQSHYWLGYAYRQLGRMREAARASSEAARLAPRNVQYLYQAALDAQSVEDYAASLTYLVALEKIDPDYESLGFAKGFALRRLGRVDEAIASYRGFLATHPEHVQAQFNLGYALLLSNRCNEAIAPFQTVLRLKPDYSEAHFHLATCYERLGDPALASRHRALYGG